MKEGAKEFVLDCSAALAWVFASEATAETDALLGSLASGGKAWVPSLWPFEVANVLLGAKRRKRIDQAGIEKFLSSLQAFDLEVDPLSLANAWNKTLGLAETFGLSAYDAAYLELALRRSLPLATLDHSLQNAAKRAGGILALPP